jgi:hypothetical protein
MDEYDYRSSIISVLTVHVDTIMHDYFEWMNTMWIETYKLKSLGSRYQKK